MWNRKEQFALAVPIPNIAFLFSELAMEWQSRLHWKPKRNQGYLRAQISVKLSEYNEVPVSSDEGEEGDSGDGGDEDDDK